jgi:hypothetical protein
MGSMSTSDAAPMPRLGEVFFDVRSTSRSLRISWYADTGVAVLSIWQGGTCTGSFRLPMGDLPRMIETLRRGPDGWTGPGAGHPPVADQPGQPAAAASHGPYPAGSRSLHYLNGSPPADYPDQTTAGYPESPGPRGRRDEPAVPHHQDLAGAADYPDSDGPGGYPRPAHYLDPRTPPHYAHHQAPALYPDEPAPLHHPDQQAMPHYPEQPAPPRNPDQQTPAHYDDLQAPPRNPDQSATAHYPDQQTPAHYPVRADRRDLPAESPSDPYPNGSGTRDYSPAPPGIESQPATSARPYGHERPAWTDQQTAPGWDTGNARSADSGLEPLPESFPYSQPHPDHELRDRQPERLRPFA